MIRRPWVVVLAWLAPDRRPASFAPRWDQVTKDDDVRFFPPDSLSVIGQDLLERGFPERRLELPARPGLRAQERTVTPDDLRYIEDVASKLLPVCASRSPSSGSRSSTRTARR